jgi:2,4-dienoyl-CoA reductase-like NADH-dependent reductase (Old Yellow Enzyme family)
MALHQPFRYATRDDLLDSARRMGLELPFQDDLSPLFEPLRIGDTTLSNRLAVHPMEGADASANGAPSELTFRRYRRYAEGGSGLIWFEATAVVAEGRANPRQLMITDENLEEYRELVQETREAARRCFGASHDILCVLQLTHSGRYSKPQGRAQPIAAVSDNPYLGPSDEAVRVLSDHELGRLQEDYLEAASLAHRSGFDAVDIKACHGYLLGELLAGHTRENSRFGSSFANRSRFLSDVYAKLRVEIPGLLVTSRLNAFDGIPFPYGFGFSADDGPAMDLTEIKALTRKLLHLGGRMFSYSAGIPALNPHLSRPYDLPLPGVQAPDEHPLEGVTRLLAITADLQRSFPEVPVVGVGYSWLRQFFPFAAAAAVRRGEASLIGMGRSALAYPEVPRDLMDSGSLDPKKVCIACSKCSQLLRGGARTGCVVRDAEVYAREFGRLTGKDP